MPVSDIISQFIPKSSQERYNVLKSIDTSLTYADHM